MSLEPQIQLLSKLGSLGESIPGLDIDPIIENLVKKSEEIKTATESIDEEEEEENERETRSERRKERKAEKERKKAGKKEKTEEEKEAQKAERKKKREETKKKAKEQKKKIIENYKKQIRVVVQENTIEIKQNYKIFKDAIESIPPDVSALITNILLPPAITVPPGGPNPLYALNLTKQAKNTLVRTLNSAIVAFTVVIKLSTAIKFEIPKPILDLFDKINIVSNLIGSIPL
jgi:chemotaxis protein histidine kinase CheA